MHSNEKTPSGTGVEPRGDRGSPSASDVAKFAPGAHGVDNGRQRFEPGAVRYIKLGEKGGWAETALADSIIPFGYSPISHRACAEGDWDQVCRQLGTMGRKGAGIGQGIRELQDFYKLPDDTLWVTMADGHFWWAFADGPVIEIPDNGPGTPARFRRSRGGRSNKSLTGVPLTVRSLSSALTGTASYRMTICSIKHADYLLRRIRGEVAPLRAAADTLRGQMSEIAFGIIQQLDWRDFETLVDLIFSRGGWQRVGVLGQDQADVDIILTQPVTGETAWVQVKSRTSQAELDDYLVRFSRDQSCDRFFFVYHSANHELALPEAKPNLHLWSGKQVADAAIDAGLLGWLAELVG